MENKYKKGDWVRCVDNGGAAGLLKIGAVYKVDRVNDVYIFIDGIGGMTKWRFEPWRPKVGERVRVPASANSVWAGDAEVVAHHASYGTYELKMMTGDMSGDTGDFRPFEIEPVTDTLPVAEQPAALTIQAGRYYKTRDGRKVGPVERNGDRRGHWYWKAPRLEGYGPYWCKNGDFYDGRGEHENDLVAEWVDTPVRDITAATVDAINDEYGPVAGELPADKPKFKVGDRVKVTGCEDGVIDKRGMVGTIVHLPMSGSTKLAVQLDGANELYFSPSELSPYQPSIVALIENGQPLPATRPAVHTSAEAADTEARRLASVHRGQEFGVFVLTGATHKEAKVYEHEWQRLAAAGRRQDAQKELKRMSGLSEFSAASAVAHFIAA